MHLNSNIWLVVFRRQCVRLWTNVHTDFMCVVFFFYFKSFVLTHFAYFQPTKVNKYTNVENVVLIHSVCHCLLLFRPRIFPLNTYTFTIANHFARDFPVQWAFVLSILNLLFDFGISIYWRTYENGCKNRSLAHGIKSVENESKIVAWLFNVFSANTNSCMPPLPMVNTNKVNKVYAVKCWRR